jgi:hypothetical protein
MVRQAYPQAELHVTVAAHITSLMDCVPWVDRVWGYMRYPRHATLKENWQMISRLRREKFDAVINLNGSDRSSWLTFLSGARERLGRVPDDGGPLFWRRMFTAHIECPRTNGAGLCSKMPLSRERPVSLSRRRNFTSKSPLKICARRKFPKPTPELIFTSARSRPPITRNCRRRNSWNSSRRSEKFPRKKTGVVLRADGTRTKKMAELLALLPQKPWRVFAGNLNLTQIAAVIQHSALHFCGDTGRSTSR